MNQLIISDYGVFLGKHSERLVIKYKDKEREDEEHALMNLSHIIVSSDGVTLSSDLISECTQRGIEISFLSFSGKPYAKLVSPALTATVITRREQIAAYNDKRGILLACAFAQGKVRNQNNVLRYFAKSRKKPHPSLYDSLQETVSRIQGLETEFKNISGEQIDEVRPTILNIEGRASALYWEAIKLLLDGKADFEKRKHQGADDPVNAAFNYGYGILYSQIWSALTLAGLEPFAGFLHVDRPGKPSLVLDFIEEFRQPIVDRTLIAMLNKRFAIKSESKTQQQDNGQFRLHADTRRELAEKILGRLEDEEKFDGKQHKLRQIIHLQAQHLAMALRSEREYTPFVCSW
jgi:CRISPR-associated protein Cas1